MRRGIVVFVSVLGLISACGSFGEGATGDGTDAGSSADGSVDGGNVPESAIAEAAPTDGNPCSSRAAKFSAVDFFQIPSTEGFDFSPMTVEAWIYVPASAASKTMQIVSHAKADKTAGWALGLAPGPALIFHSYVSGEGQPLGGSAPQSAVATNRWVHVAVTRNGTQVQLVIDGKTSAPFSSNFKFGATTTNANLTVGASSLDGLERFQGLIEEIRISNVVRTISIDRKTSEPDANTVALWRFDEPGSDAVDSSGNGKNLGEEGKVLRVCMARFADDDVTP